MAGCTRRAMRRNPNGTDVLVNEAGARGGVFAGGARGSHVAGLARRALAASLSALLAFSLVPAQAWAGEAAAASGAAAVEEEANDEQVELSEPSIEGDQVSSEPETEEVSDASASMVSEDGSQDSGAGQVGSPSSPQASSDQVDVAADEIEVTATIIGADAAGNTQVWVPEASYTVEEGSTAADLIERILDEEGLAHEATGQGTSDYYLSTITSPDGSVLGWDAETGRYWQLFQNGTAAETGAGSIELEPGDSIALYYSAYGDELPAEDPGQGSVAINVIGRDAAGDPQDWGTVDIPINDSSATLDVINAALDELGLAHEFEAAPDDDSMHRIFSITAPGGEPLVSGAVDDNTWLVDGDAWYFAVDGEGADVWIEYLSLNPGSTLTMYYGAFNKVPEIDDGEDTELTPDAPRPDYDSSWPFASGTASGAVTIAPTPTEAAGLDWTYDFGANEGEPAPIIVNGDVYLVVGSTLRKVDGATGALLVSVEVGAPIAYFCRPVYADGLIIVPADDGTLTAFTADTLTAVWKSQRLFDDSSYQATSTLTVSNGYVYAAFGVPGSNDNPSTAGALVCVSVADGSVKWERSAQSADTGTLEGYYWAGAVASGDDIVIGDDAGRVSLIDGETGGVLSQVSIGASCRAGIVVSESDPNAFFAVARDGSLHKVVRSGDVLALAGSVSFAAASTSTPAVAGGKVFVCGVDAQGYGTLSVIDGDSLAVDRTVRGGKGAAQSSPLVSTQADGTYVYFTCNALPGGVYVYRVGDAAARELYVPDADEQQHCIASVICDPEGALYYFNDSGVLFKLSGRAQVSVSFDTHGGSEVAPVYVPVGGLVQQPEKPTRPGYVFTGWFTDSACTHAWDFSTPVSESMTLHAGWRKVSSAGGTPAGTPGASLMTPVGTVAPAATPLGASEEAAADAAGAEAVATSADEAGGAVATRMLAAPAESRMNLWAIAGVGAGIVGIAAIGLFLGLGKRQGGR